MSNVNQTLVTCWNCEKRWYVRDLPEPGRHNLPCPHCGSPVLLVTARVDGVMTRMCEYDGCDNPYKVSGMCASHSKRLAKELAPPPPCKWDDPTPCNKESVGQGYCTTHYYKALELGLIERKAERKKKD